MQKQVSTIASGVFIAVFLLFIVTNVSSIHNAGKDLGRSIQEFISNNHE